MLKIKKLHVFTFLLWKQTICVSAIDRDIPTIHNGYCVSNEVDYAKKNDVLQTICQLN